MALDGLNSVTAGISSVAVHLERHMLGDGTLLQSADQHFTKLAHGPIAGRRLEDHSPQEGRNGIRHCGGVCRGSVVAVLCERWEKETRDAACCLGVEGQETMG